MNSNNNSKSSSNNSNHSSQNSKKNNQKSKNNSTTPTTSINSNSSKKNTTNSHVNVSKIAKVSDSSTSVNSAGTTTSVTPSITPSTPTGTTTTNTNGVTTVANTTVNNNNNPNSNQQSLCEPSASFTFKVPHDLSFPHEFPLFNVHSATFTVRLVQNPRNDEIGVFLRCISGGPLHLPFTFLVQDDSGVVLANHCDTTQVFKANVTWGKRNLLTKAKEKLVKEDEGCLRVTLVLISGCVCGETRNLRICTTCKARYYCCPEHQKQDWPKHKKVCNELAICGITWMLRRIFSWQQKGILSATETGDLKSKICSQPHLAILNKNDNDVIKLLEDKVHLYKESYETLEKKFKTLAQQNLQLKKGKHELEKQTKNLQYKLNVANASLKEIELLKTVTERSRETKIKTSERN